MKKNMMLGLLLSIFALFFVSCEFEEHGKDAFLGNFTTEIDYANSVVELAVDKDLSDNDLSTNPPTDFQAIGEADKTLFIDAYFLAAAATVTDLGGDSIKYADAKRSLRGAVNDKDSVYFVKSDLGPNIPMDGIVIDSTVLYTKGKLITNDIHMEYVFSGTGSVSFPGYPTKLGIVRGTVKMVAKK